MKNFKNKLIGFTLAEMMVIFFIVGVIAATSIGIYRTQINLARRYSYYAAFATLRQAIGGIAADGTIQNPAATPPADLVKDELLPDAGNRLYNDGSVATKFSDGTHKDTYNGLCQRFTEIVNALDPVDCSLTVSNPALPFTKDTAGTNKANFVLSNGIRYYNMGANPTVVGADPTHLSDYFTVYIDINGAYGKGVTGLYSNNNVDVLPFKILRSGQIIPALDSDSLGPSRAFLTAAVKYDTGSSEEWLETSVSYLDAACHAGIVVGTHCPAASLPKATVCCNTTTCTAGTYHCEVVLIKP